MLSVEDVDQVNEWLMNVAVVAVAANVLPRRGDTVAFERDCARYGTTLSHEQMAVGTILFGIMESVEVVWEHLKGEDNEE